MNDMISVIQMEANDSHDNNNNNIGTKQNSRVFNNMNKVTMCVRCAE